MVCVVVAGCNRTAPPPPPLPPVPQFTFPPCAGGTPQSVDNLLPTGTEVEFIVPFDPLVTTVQSLERIDIKIFSADERRVVRATAQLQRSSSGGSGTEFRGRINKVLKSGPVKVILTTPEGASLGEYEARYE